MKSFVMCMYFSPKWGSEPIIMLWHIHVLWSAGNSEKFSVEKSERVGLQGRIGMYVYRFQIVFLRCPTPRLHCFLSSHWPSFRFLSFMAFLIPSIQFFFSLPRALFCFDIHFNAILGNLSSAILWTWPYHFSFSMCVFFRLMGCWPIDPTQTWRTSVSIFVWVLSFDLSAKGGPTSSYATAGIAFWIIAPRKPPYPTNMPSSRWRYSKEGRIGT